MASVPIDESARVLVHARALTRPHPCTIRVPCTCHPPPAPAAQEVELLSMEVEFDEEASEQSDMGERVALSAATPLQVRRAGASS